MLDENTEKEKMCSFQEIMSRIKEMLEKKLFGDVRISIKEGRIKEAHITESRRYN
jgi:hypothetical protein